MMVLFNRKGYLAHGKGGFGCNKELASWGQRAWNITRMNSAHGHSSKSHLDCCGWEVLHRSCVAEATFYAVVPGLPVCEIGSNHASCWGQAKVLGKAAIGRQMLTHEAYHLSRPSSLSLSLCSLSLTVVRLI